MADEVEVKADEAPVATSTQRLADVTELLTRSEAEEISSERIAQLNNQFECFGANVVVARYTPADEKTEGGLYKRKLTRSQEAIVVLAGPGEWANGIFMPIPPGIFPGQRVLVTKHGGTDIELDGVTLLLLHVKQIYIHKKPVVIAP
jgi:co-chaperonin GroES (HSP10)